MSTKVAFVSVAQVILGLWNLILFISLCYKFIKKEAEKRKSNQKSVINIHLKRLSLTLIFIEFVTYFYAAIVNGLEINQGYFNLIVWILSVIVYVLFYLYHTISLYIVFRKSVYAISKQVLYIHFAIVVVILIVPPSLTPFYTNPTVYYVSSVSICILVLFGLIHIMYKFNHNLILLICNEKRRRLERSRIPKIIAVEGTTKNSNNSGRAIPGNVEESSKRASTIEVDDKNARELSLLRAVTKQTLLSSVQIVSLIVMIFYIIIIIIIGRNTDITWIIWYGVQCIVIGICSTCVYLGFAINGNIYHNVCKICHNSCRDKCDSADTRTRPTQIT